MVILSNLKTNNYLLNILAIQFAKENDCDDAIILNSDGNICEASSSNLFMVQKGIIFTPVINPSLCSGYETKGIAGTASNTGISG